MNREQVRIICAIFAVILNLVLVSNWEKSLETHSYKVLRIMDAGDGTLDYEKFGQIQEAMDKAPKSIALVPIGKIGLMTNGGALPTWARLAQAGLWGAAAFFLAGAFIQKKEEE